MPFINYDQRRRLHGEEYMERLLRQESTNRLLRLMKYIELRKEYSVADFACGNAAMLELLYPKVKNYYGVDFSESAIKNAEKRKNKIGAKNAYFQCGSIQSFCNKNRGKFDVMQNLVCA